MSNEMIQALEYIRQLISDGANEDEAIEQAKDVYELTFGQIRALRSHLEPWA